MSIKRFFRKEPVVSTVVTAGTVNIALGTLEGQALLAFLGVVVVSGAIALRGWQRYRLPMPIPERPPLRYLPEFPSRPPLPDLEAPQRRPPTPPRG